LIREAIGYSLEHAPDQSQNKNYKGIQNFGGNLMCIEENRHVGMMRHRKCKGGRARGFGLTASNTKLI